MEEGGSGRGLRGSPKTTRGRGEVVQWEAGQGKGMAWHVVLVCPQPDAPRHDTARVRGAKQGSTSHEGVCDGAKGMSGNGRDSRLLQNHRRGCWLVSVWGRAQGAT